MATTRVLQTGAPSIEEAPRRFSARVFLSETKATIKQAATTFGHEVKSKLHIQDNVSSDELVLSGPTFVSDAHDGISKRVKEDSPTVTHWSRTDELGENGQLIDNEKLCDRTSDEFFSVDEKDLIKELTPKEYQVFLECKNRGVELSLQEVQEITKMTPEDRECFIRSRSVENLSPEEAKNLSVDQFNDLKAFQSLPTPFTTHANTSQYYDTLIQHITMDEGSIRVSGRKDRANEIMESRESVGEVSSKFNQGDWYDSTHVAVSALKATLLTDPLLSPQALNGMKEKGVDTINEKTPQDIYNELKAESTPEQKKVFDQLLLKMAEVCDNTDITRMTPETTGIAIGATLFKCDFDIKTDPVLYRETVTPINGKLMEKLLDPELIKEVQVRQAREKFDNTLSEAEIELIKSLTPSEFQVFIEFKEGNISLSLEEAQKATKMDAVDRKTFFEEKRSNQVCLSLENVLQNINPNIKGNLRVNGVKATEDDIFNHRNQPEEVKSKLEGIESESDRSHIAAIALKRILIEERLIPEENIQALRDADASRLSPEEVYSVLTNGLSDEKRRAFDQIIAKIVEIEAHQDINKMTLNNLAVALGPALLDNGEGLEMGPMDALSGNEAAFEKLIEHSRSLS